MKGRHARCMGALYTTRAARSQPLHGAHAQGFGLDRRPSLASELAGSIMCFTHQTYVNVTTLCAFAEHWYLAMLYTGPCECPLLTLYLALWLLAHARLRLCRAARKHR